MTADLWGMAIAGAVLWFVIYRALVARYRGNTRPRWPLIALGLVALITFGAILA